MPSAPKRLDKESYRNICLVPSLKDVGGFIFVVVNT